MNQITSQNYLPFFVQKYLPVTAHKAIGKKDTHLDSLQALFMGTSYGERRLYIVGGQPTTAKYDNTFVGYLLYKKTDGTNVLQKLRHGEKEWEVIEVKEKKPKKE